MLLLQTRLIIFLSIGSFSHLLLFFFLMIRRPPSSTLFPSPTLFRSIATVVAGALETFPARPPSLVRGAAVYQEQCAQCHGATGRGDGPKAKHLQGPPPASLADRKSTRLNSSHRYISYAVLCLQKKKA